MLRAILIYSHISARAEVLQNFKANTHAVDLHNAQRDSWLYASTVVKRLPFQQAEILAHFVLHFVASIPG